MWRDRRQWVIHQLVCWAGANKSSPYKLRYYQVSTTVASDSGGFSARVRVHNRHLPLRGTSAMKSRRLRGEQNVWACSWRSCLVFGRSWVQNSVLRPTVLSEVLLDCSPDPPYKFRDNTPDHNPFLTYF